jgi:hypothetical protein
MVPAPTQGDGKRYGMLSGDDLPWWGWWWGGGWALWWAVALAPACEDTGMPEGHLEWDR